MSARNCVFIEVITEIRFITNNNHAVILSNFILHQFAKVNQFNSKYGLGSEQGKRQRDPQHRYSPSAVIFGASSVQTKLRRHSTHGNRSNLGSPTVLWCSCQMQASRQGLGEGSCGEPTTHLNQSAAQAASADPGADGLSVRDKN